MLLNLVSILIAIVSLTISFYVVFRDRKIKRLDNLHSCRQNLLNIFEQIDVLTVEEMIDYFEENPSSDQAQKYSAKSKEITLRVDREFEYTCYLVIRKQIDFKSFFDLFKSWLAMRQIDWDSRAKYKIKNYPYTWAVIQKCLKKDLLPINKSLQK